MGRTVAVVACLSIACVACGRKRGTHAAAAGNAGSGVPIRAVATMHIVPPHAQIDAGTTTTAAAAAATAPAAITDADRVAVAKYRVAMRLGREATAANKTAAAITAFDAALAAKPNDARALAERGYAKLVGGSDLAGASADLRTAGGGTKDPKLLAQIWFNRGLVDEKSPDTARNAAADFFIANTLSPSAAAARKLASASAGSGATGQACPLHVDRDYKLTVGDDVAAADWLDFATTVQVMTPDGAPTTLAAAKAALFPNGVEPTLPAVVHTGDAGIGEIDYLVVHRGTALRAFAVGQSKGPPCAGAVDFAVAEVVGDVVHVHGTELHDAGMTPSCRHGDDDHADCTGGDGDNFTGMVCDGGTPTVRDLVIDTLAAKALLAVERPQLDATAAVSAKLDGSGLRLAGLGCDRVEALRP